MLTMPTAYGAEFRQDVIDVARKGEAPLAQIAKDFGIIPAVLTGSPALSYAVNQRMSGHFRAGLAADRRSRLTP
jgi:hypothetical protein